MNNKIMMMTIATMLFASVSFAQTLNEVDVAKINADHDRMITLIQKSEKLPVPEYVTEELKKFAKQKGYNEQSVLRNYMLLCPIYNTDLTADDRLFACKMATKACTNENAYIPISLVNKLKDEILKK